MFVADAASKSYLRPVRRQRGWGRILLLVTALLVVSAQLAYGSSPARYDRVVVAPGDTLWGIAAAHYRGDPRARVDQIIRVNHLASPALTPGQALRIPID
jgi:LysM repeat protein